MLVRDVADDGLDQILDRHQPVDAAILVHHQRHVDARLAHLQQQLQHRHAGHHQQGAAKDGGHRKGCVAADAADDVLDVHHAHDVIEVAVIDRIARMALRLDQRQCRVQRQAVGQRHDVGARNHDVHRGDAAQLQHIGQQRAFLQVQLRRVGRGGVGGALDQLLHPVADAFMRAAAQLAGQAVQPGFVGAVAHAERPPPGLHGLGRRSRCMARASACSMRRASPASM